MILEYDESGVWFFYCGNEKCTDLENYNVKVLNRDMDEIVGGWG